MISHAAGSDLQDIEALVNIISHCHPLISHAADYCLQDIEAQDDDLQLTLKMALEPDLRLRFFDAAHYSTWKRGFETLQQLLFSPG